MPESGEYRGQGMGKQLGRCGRKLRSRPCKYSRVATGWSRVPVLSWLPDRVAFDVVKDARQVTREDRPWVQVTERWSDLAWVLGCGAYLPSSLERLFLPMPRPQHVPSGVEPCRSLHSDTRLAMAARASMGFGADASSGQCRTCKRKRKTARSWGLASKLTEREAHPIQSQRSSGVDAERSARSCQQHDGGGLRTRISKLSDGAGLLDGRYRSPIRASLLFECKRSIAVSPMASCL